MTDLIAELAEVVRLQRLVDATYGCECENAMEDRDNAAVNFLRTHHAEIEAMARDAARWRYVVARAEWIRDEDDTLMAVRFAGVRVNLDSVGTRTDAIDRAMHDSAREGGE